MYMLSTANNFELEGISYDLSTGGGSVTTNWMVSIYEVRRAVILKYPVGDSGELICIRLISWLLSVHVQFVTFKLLLSKLSSKEI